MADEKETILRQLVKTSDSIADGGACSSTLSTSPRNAPEYHGIFRVSLKINNFDLIHSKKLIAIYLYLQISWNFHSFLKIYNNFDLIHSK